MPRDTSSSGDDRIAKLSQRFKTHAVGRRPGNTRTRERHSLYLDAELIAEANEAYRQVSHELFPANVSKSAFWEALLGYGLEHLSELKRDLLQRSGAAENSET